MAVGAAAWFRFSSYGLVYAHPDEIISTVIAAKVSESGDLDTNWNNAAELPDYFRYPQFNFSGWHLVAASWLSVTRSLGMSFETVDTLRVLSGLLSMGVIAVTYFLGKQWFSHPVGILSAAVVSVQPLLFQDSLYARPESLVTLLTVVFLLVLTTHRLRESTRQVIAGSLLGFLVATKVSMLALLPLMFLIRTKPVGQGQPSDATGSWRYLRNCGSSVTASLPFSLLGLITGFALGAPGALLNVGDFVFGAEQLRNQYATGHWPHGLPDGNLLERAHYALTYLTSTSGWAILLFAVVGAVSAFLRRYHQVVWSFVFLTIAAAQASVTAAFFERNLSHLLPSFVILASYGAISLLQLFDARRLAQVGIATALVLALLLPGLGTSMIIRFSELSGTQREQVESIRNDLERWSGVRASRPGWIPDDREAQRAIAGQRGPVLLEFLWPGDRYSKRVLERLQSEGFQVLASVDSSFSQVPPSTLHTYFTPTTIWLYRGGNTTH